MKYYLNNGRKFDKKKIELKKLCFRDSCLKFD